MKEKYMYIHYEEYLSMQEDIDKFIDFIYHLQNIPNKELQNRIADFNENVRRMWC